MAVSMSCAALAPRATQTSARSGERSGPGALNFGIRNAHESELDRVLKSLAKSNDIAALKLYGGFRLTKG